MTSFVKPEEAGRNGERERKKGEWREKGKKDKNMREGRGMEERGEGKEE